MARTVETEKLTKHTIWLYEGDFAKLASFFPDLGSGVALRRVLRAQLNKLESGVSAAPVIKETLDV